MVYEGADVLAQGLDLLNLLGEGLGETLLEGLEDAVSLGSSGEALGREECGRGVPGSWPSSSGPC